MTTYHAMSYFTYNLYGLQGKKVVSKHVLLAVLDKQNLYELAEMLLLTFICLLSISLGERKLHKISKFLNWCWDTFLSSCREAGAGIHPGPVPGRLVDTAGGVPGHLWGRRGPYPRGTGSPPCRHAASSTDIWFDVRIAILLFTINFGTEKIIIISSIN